jgi:O-acetyl-ADP-ribose deacetylase (regulator of RNase III)
MTTIGEHTLPNGLRLVLVQGDLTKQRVDAIVNAANEHLQHGGGVAAAIRRAGGSVIRAESNAWVAEHGPINHDEPAVTSAGDLPCRLVIHAVGPRWGEGDEHDKLRRAVAASLQTGHGQGVTSLALPAISTGIFGFPKEQAAAVILAAIEDFDMANPETPLKEVRVTLLDRPTLEPFRRIFHQRWGEGARPA